MATPSLQEEIVSPRSQQLTPAGPLAGLPKLQRLSAAVLGQQHGQQSLPKHVFLRPVKQIHDGTDVSQFLVSKGYRDLCLFIMQLNHALCPRTKAVATESSESSESSKSPKSSEPTKTALTTTEPAAPSQQPPSQSSLSSPPPPPLLPPPSRPPASAPASSAIPPLSGLLRKATANAGATAAATTTLFTLQTPRRDPPAVRRLQTLLDRLAALVDEAPPDPGPRRFGNASFRTWHELLAKRAEVLLAEAVELPPSRDAAATAAQDDGPQTAQEATAMDEIKAYFLGGFGSAQRLDYGTGHELSFLAFLGCLWKLGVFAETDDNDDDNGDDDDESLERSIVLGVLEPYLRVVRKLILTYTLEPAGSHGVWGLDDHSFLPYIFGSAQLTQPIHADSPDGLASAEPMPQEGSAPRAPRPADILKPSTLAVQREHNLYFAAVGFIADVKRGPFWEHSPVLYDVSGIRDGWGKINKGMIKMYNAEVLSKFPVVQHFPFGSLFAWDEDPDAAAPMASIHLANQPSAGGAADVSGVPVAPRAPRVPRPPAPLGPPATRMPPPMAAPWAQSGRIPPASVRARPAQQQQQQQQHQEDAQAAQPATRAPWAK